MAVVAVVVVVVIVGLVVVTVVVVVGTRHFGPGVSARRLSRPRLGFRRVSVWYHVRMIMSITNYYQSTCYPDWP